MIFKKKKKNTLKALETPAVIAVGVLLGYGIVRIFTKRRTDGESILTKTKEVASEVAKAVVEEAEKEVKKREAQKMEDMGVPPEQVKELLHVVDEDNPDDVEVADEEEVQEVEG